MRSTRRGGRGTCSESRGGMGVVFRVFEPQATTPRAFARERGLNAMKNSKRRTTERSGLRPSLSPEAKRLKKKLESGFEIGDENGQLILSAAFESFDRMRDAQAILAREGLVSQDRFGQTRAHPMLVVERDSRNSYLRALKALNLDVIPPGPVGRPAGGS